MPKVSKFCTQNLNKALVENPIRLFELFTNNYFDRLTPNIVVKIDKDKINVYLCLIHYKTKFKKGLQFVYFTMKKRTIFVNLVQWYKLL